MTRKLSAVLFLVLAFMPSVARAATYAETATLNAFDTAATLACTQRAITPCSLLQVTREVLPNNVVHYKALIRVGAGDYDVIALHRLVRESNGVGFIHTVGSFFFLPGASETFRLAVMDPLGGGLGTFLSERNVDVWGLDYRNVQIPSDVDAPTVGSDWGFDLQIKDIGVGTRIARLVRAQTGQSAGKINLGGHSIGGTLSYAVANAEAVLSESEADVGGIIPIDSFYMFHESATFEIGFDCFMESMWRSWVSAGASLPDNIVPIVANNLALTDPSGVSPFAPPLTNLQIALEQAGATPGWPPFGWHPWSVIRDSSGIAFAGRYTSTEEILHNGVAQPRYSVAMLAQADMAGTGCPSSNSPYIRHVAEIKIPVLYVGSAGGNGENAGEAIQLLGSSDKTLIMVKLMPDTDVVNDYGHMDPLTATNAKQLVWQPIHGWIVEHSH